MTEEQFIDMRSKIRAMNIENVLGWQMRLLRTVVDMLPLPIRAQVLAAISTSLAAQKKEYEVLPFKGLSTEWADLMSSENREQFLAICKEIVARLGLPHAA